MSKTITLRVRDELYDLIRTFAENENRTLSNFLETSIIRFIEHRQFADEFKMAEIQNNQELNHSLKRALRDANTKKGRFVE